MAISYNAALSFVFVAESILEYPDLQRDFEEFYKTDKYRFYERARHNQYYEHKNMMDRALDKGVSMRRIFGILLCAEDDEFIQSFVRRKLLGIDRRFEQIIRNPNQTAITALCTHQQESMDIADPLITAPLRFLGYLLYSAFGIDSENEAVDGYLANNQQNYWMLSNLLDATIGFSEHIKYYNIVIPRNIRSITSKINTAHDINGLSTCLIKAKLKCDLPISNTELYGYIEAYNNSGEYEAHDVDTALFTINTAESILATYGISITGLLGRERIMDDDHKQLIRILATANYSTPRNGKLFANHINISAYIKGLVFMLMAKEIRSMKEFCFRNNSETQYLELQRLEDVIDDKDKEIERLKAELACANEQNEQQRHEIRRLTQEIYKENKDAIKPLESEISALNGRIRDLEESLADEQMKNPELNALREFAFSLQSEYIPPKATVSLEELIKAKKIVIVGGHVNWCNKMRERYPAITFLDGNSVSFDNALFDNADITLLYTAHMSHKVYYKAIDYLRDKKLKFDYLGRNTNQALLESEIVSILQEKLQL